MEEILIGTTDRTILVFIPDPASTDGSGKTGLNAAALTVSYTRVETDNDVVITDVTSSLNDLSALTDAHNDWGLKEVSNTLAPGVYRLDIADAVFATGAWYGLVYVEITSSAAAATPKVFKLVNFDLFGQSAADLKDFADDGYDPSTNKVQGVVLTDTVTTLTNDPTGVGTLLTRLGTPSNLGGGATVAANLSDIEGQTDDIGVAGAGLSAIPDLAGVTTLLSRLGTPSNLGGGATVSANLSDIESQTDDIGVAGAGLSAIPWNASWDAEVESEVTDALTAFGVSTLNAAGVRTAVGLASANLDTQLSAIAGFIDTEVASILASFPANFAAMGINASGHVSRVTLVDTLTTYTGNTVQTGDSYAIVNSGTHGNAALLAALPRRIQKNTALAAFEFLMVDATDHVTAETGLTITATRSIDGGAFGACANSASEVGNGIYKIDLAAGDLNGNVITLKFSSTGADTRYITLVTQT